MKLYIIENQTNVKDLTAYQKLINDFSDRFDAAFTDLGLTIEYVAGKPKLDIKEYINPLWFDVKIGNMVFTFYCNVQDRISRQLKSSPTLSWSQSKISNNKDRFITVDVAQQILDTTKIVNKLSNEFKSEYTKLLS